MTSLDDGWWARREERLFLGSTRSLHGSRVSWGADAAGAVMDALGGTHTGMESRNKKSWEPQKACPCGFSPPTVKTQPYLHRVRKETGPAALQDTVSERWLQEHVNCLLQAGSRRVPGSSAQ